MRFRRSSTLIRWETDTLTKFRKRLLRWRLSKTDAFPISVDGRKDRKRMFSVMNIQVRFRVLIFLVQTILFRYMQTK